MLDKLPEFISNHPILSAMFVIILLTLIVNELTKFTRKYKSLTPAQLTKLINRENALLIDVSPSKEFDGAHIVGSKNVQMSQFDPESKDLAKVKELPVALVCRRGQTAAQACERLTKAGFTQVYLLEGGIQAWQTAELPLAKGRY